MFSLHRSDICLFVEVIIQWVVFRCAALSGCCAPMLPLRGCRVSMRALGCRWRRRRGGNGGNSQAVDHIGAVLHGGIHITYTHTFFRARHDSVWCMSVSIMWGSGPNNRLNLGCHQRRGAAARARGGVEKGETHTGVQSIHTRITYMLHGGRGKPAQSGQRATRMSNTCRFTKSHRLRASEDRRK